MEEVASELGAEADELINGFFRDHKFLNEGTRAALQAPDRKYPPLPPEYDGRLFDWLTLLLDRAHAERAWPVILELVARAPTAEALGFVGAAALEELVNDFGPQFEARILDQAEHDARFREALSGVWPQEDAPESLVKAIEAAADERAR